MTDDNFFEFLKRAGEVAGSKDNPETWGVLHNFTCPCGSEARAVRSSLNGHLYAECQGCGMKIIE